MYLNDFRVNVMLMTVQVFQGIGGGGMTTVVSILMSDIVPLRDRGVWQGIINIIYATGSGTGAPLGKKVLKSLRSFFVNIE